MKLTATDISEILSSEKSTAEYLAHLTTAQIDLYLGTVSGDKALDAKAKKTLTTLLQRVREERLNAERQIGWRLAPAVAGIVVAKALDDQITALEAIQRELE